MRPGAAWGGAGDRSDVSADRNDISAEGGDAIGQEVPPPLTSARSLRPAPGVAVHDVTVTPASQAQVSVQVAGSKFTARAGPAASVVGVGVTGVRAGGGAVRWRNPAHPGPAHP